jgi:NADH:ubiquinone oxidoreductase subunit K
MATSLIHMIQFIPIIALLSLVSQQKHLLMALLSLEGVILSLVLLIPVSLSIIFIPIQALCLILLRFGACEARLGLALLVSIARFYGSDHVKSLSINKC